MIHLSSPVILGNPEVAHPISPRYTCSGADVSLPLKWGLVPSGTREVGVFVFNHIKGGHLAADWAVLGLKPSVREVRTGQVPAGGIVGRNSAGHDSYHVCPPKGKKLEYGVFVYAFTKSLHVRPGFNPVAVVEHAAQGKAAGYGLIGFTTQR